MRVLIFGSKGFIGSSFKNYFDEDIIGVVDNINFLSKEILMNYDILINCAGASNVSASFYDPQKDFNKNTVLVLDLLEKIRLSGNKNIKFINISSAAVYGNPPSLPVKTEFAENSRALSPYGVHKRLSEILLKSYHDSFGISTCSLRIFSAYGNGQKKLLMWDLFQKFTENSIDKVELYGTGFETRDFIHINDIIQQIELVFSNAKFQGEALNIGNGIETSINEIAHIFKDCLISNKEIKFNNIVREGDPLNWCADISELIQWGYEQNVNLKKGIMLYIKSNLNEKSN